MLLLNFPDYVDDNNRKEWIDFAMRFQQITGPVMAKGVEDTTFYVYSRLVSLNEVGGNPERFGIPLETFHGQNIERIKFWPNALIATSTHDTKRSEDVRARINVLYLPLEVMGGKSNNICAFARRIGNRRVIIAVPRFFTELIPQPTDLPFGEAVWGASFIVVPIAEPGARYRNIFTGELLTARDYKDATALHLSEVFSNFPVALIERIYD